MSIELDKFINIDLQYTNADNTQKTNFTFFGVVRMSDHENVYFTGAEIFNAHV